MISWVPTVSLTFLTRHYSVLFCNVITDIDVRLLQDSYYGPVEVRRYGIWGYICGSGWDDEDADVVCRTLNYRTGQAVRSVVSDGDPIIMGNVGCRGVEAHFADCILDSLSIDTGCYTRESIAGVICLNSSGKLSFKSTYDQCRYIHIYGGGGGLL